MMAQMAIVSSVVSRSRSASPGRATPAFSRGPAECSRIAPTAHDACADIAGRTRGPPPGDAVTSEVHAPAWRPARWDAENADGGRSPTIGRTPDGPQAAVAHGRSGCTDPRAHPHRAGCGMRIWRISESTSGGGLVPVLVTAAILLAGRANVGLAAQAASGSSLALTAACTHGWLKQDVALPWTSVTAVAAAGDRLWAAGFTKRWRDIRRPTLLRRTADAGRRSVSRPWAARPDSSTWRPREMEKCGPSDTNRSTACTGRCGPGPLRCHVARPGADHRSRPAPRSSGSWPPRRAWWRWGSASAIAVRSRSSRVAPERAGQSHGSMASEVVVPC